MRGMGRHSPELRWIKGGVLEWKMRPFGLERMQKKIPTARCRCPWHLRPWILIVLGISNS